MVFTYARPDADSADGNWTNEANSQTNLFASIDETVASDTDFIQSGPAPSGDIVKLSLSNPGASTTPATVRYRYKKRDDGSPSVNLIVSLLQGTTEIVSWTHSDISTSYVDAEQDITSVFGTISDVNNLFLQFNAGPWWYANASIDLDFQNGRYYDSSAGGPGVAVTSYLSCVRSSTGFAKNSDGTLTSFAANALRITDLGLLVEQGATNEVLWSEDFSNAAWTKTNGSVTTDAAVAPDGATTADKFTPNTSASAAHSVSQGSLSNLNTAPTPYSVFMKDAGYGFGCLVCAASSTDIYSIVVNLSTGAVTTTNTVGAPTVKQTVIEQYTSGWWRLQVIINGSTVAGTIKAAASNSGTPSFDANGVPTFTGDGSSGVYIWGAQYSVNRFPATSYMPTDGSTFSRASDAVTCSGTLDTLAIANTGSCVISCPAMEVKFDNGDAGMCLLGAVSGGNRNNLISVDSAGNTIFELAEPNGGASATLPGGTSAFNVATITACGWSSSARSIVVNNGTLASVGTGVSATTTGGARVGSETVFGSATKTYIRRIAFWNSKLADATLQALSTPP